MALIHVNFFSEILGMYRSMDVILPQARNGIGQDVDESSAWCDIPVLYLLHGGTDNHTMWQRHTSIERYAIEKGLAVVMPSTDMGCYTDMEYGYDFFRFYGEELPHIVQGFFTCITVKREKTFVAGQSMGGYGALKLATVYPERFSNVAAMSALVKAEGLFENLLPPSAKVPDFSVNIFGSREKIIGTINDIYADTDNMLENAKELPNFLMICGTEDFLYRDNLDYYEKYKEKMDLTALWPSGGHQWWFWDAQIQKVLEWLPIETGKEKG